MGDESKKLKIGDVLSFSELDELRYKDLECSSYIQPDQSVESVIMEIKKKIDHLLIRQKEIFGCLESLKNWKHRLEKIKKENGEGK